MAWTFLERFLDGSSSSLTVFHRGVVERMRSPTRLFLATALAAFLQVPSAMATDWTQKLPAKSPPGRRGQAMAYDSAHGQVVLFGGVGADNTVLSDTWTWDGSNWTQRSPASSPPARNFHAMAYDSSHRQVVLFGGSPSSFLSLLS